MTNPDNVGVPSAAAKYSEVTAEIEKEMRNARHDNVGGLYPSGDNVDRMIELAIQCGIDNRGTSWPLELCQLRDGLRAELCRTAPAGGVPSGVYYSRESGNYARMDVGVAPHGPYTVLRDLLTKAKGWQEAAALLRKLQQGADYVMVPRVPTEAMEAAFCEAWFAKKRPIDDPEMADAYAAMIAASQGQEGGSNG